MLSVTARRSPSTRNVMVEVSFGASSIPPITFCSRNPSGVAPISAVTMS